MIHPAAKALLEEILDGVDKYIDQRDDWIESGDGRDEEMSNTYRRLVGHVYELAEMVPDVVKVGSDGKA